MFLLVFFYGVWCCLKIRAKVFHNKKNNQLMVSLPRKQLSFLKGRQPKEIVFKIRKGDVKW